MYNPKKIPVGVTARFRPDGLVTPLSIRWEDGREFPIDRVLTRKTAPHTFLMTFHVEIRGRQRTLYFTTPPTEFGPHWYVLKHPEGTPWA